MSRIHHRDLLHLKQRKHHAEEGGEGPALHESPGWRLGMDDCVSFLPGKNLLTLSCCLKEGTLEKAPISLTRSLMKSSAF